MQTNIAENIQVNTAVSASGEPKNEQSKLLQCGNGKRSDAGTAGASVGADSSMDTLDAVDRPKNPRPEKPKSLAIRSEVACGQCYALSRKDSVSSAVR